jgi:hypothetical protein
MKPEIPFRASARTCCESLRRILSSLILAAGFLTMGSGLLPTTTLGI